MALYAEWDHGTNNVTSIRNDDPAPGSLSTGVTGAERGTNSEKQWYPLEVEYPEDYVPRFPKLLGPSRMELVDGVVHQTFENANFSPYSVREALKDEVDLNTRNALSTTDWYVVRQIETGKVVPPDVRALRQRIRFEGDRLKEDIDNVPAESLLDYDTAIRTRGTKPNELHVSASHNPAAALNHSVTSL